MLFPVLNTFVCIKFPAEILVFFFGFYTFLRYSTIHNGKIPFVSTIYEHYVHH